jgi:hypothetical protein
VPDQDHSTTSTVAPGTLTALLREVARSPIPDDKRLPFLRPGQVVGRFELVREIGRGGFGVVFEACDRELGRAVALKAVRMGGNLELKQERLLREAEAAAQLSHPNIVILHDMGRFEHGPYLVMELLRGCSLGERLARGAIPPCAAVDIAVDVGKALAHAHAQGVVHRDLSPGNVFLCSDGRVKVLDFGMAQAFGRPKVDGGTRPYMAPEQWTGAAEDARTDVFALGVILHQMLSGRVPFPDARALDGSPPPRLASEGPLAELVARMLARSPEERPRGAQELLDALLAIRGALEGAPPEPPGRARRQSSRVARAAVVGAAAALAAAVALALTQRDDRAPQAPPATTVPEARAIPPPLPPPPVAPAATAVPIPRAPAPSAPPVRAAVGRRLAPPPAELDCRDTLNALGTPTKASGEGVLTIEADPFAEVFVNGRTRGETPAECRAPAGTYTLRAVHPKYGAREARVQVRAGERTRWTADFVGAPSP